MKPTKYVLFALVFGLVSIPCLASYPKGYTWDFAKMFSKELATGQRDAANNSTWEYLYFDTPDSKPSDAILMQSFHHWEKVPGWQRDKKVEHMDRICADRVQAYSGKGGIQINWVAPMSGKVSVVVRAEKFQGSPAANNTFSLYKNDDALAIAKDGQSYSEIIETIEIKKGERLSFRLLTMGGWAWFNYFQFTVSLVNEDT